MHWLTKYTNKECHTSDVHSINMGTLLNNHPYISSSKFSANSWHDTTSTATYVGMLNNMVMLWSVYHLCGIPC